LFFGWSFSTLRILLLCQYASTFAMVRAGWSLGLEVAMVSGRSQV
jgi:hypothetical protein